MVPIKKSVKLEYLLPMQLCGAKLSEGILWAPSCQCHRLQWYSSRLVSDANV